MKSWRVSKNDVDETPPAISLIYAEVSGRLDQPLNPT